MAVYANDTVSDDATMDIMCANRGVFFSATKNENRPYFARHIKCQQDL